MEELHLNELNAVWKDIKTIISQLEKQISALDHEKERHEETLKTLKWIGYSSGFEHDMNTDSWGEKEIEK